MHSKRVKPIRGGSITIKSSQPDTIYQMSGNAQPGTLVLSGSAKTPLPVNMLIEKPLPKNVTAYRMPQLVETVEKPALTSLTLARPSKPRAPKRNTIKM